MTRCFTVWASSVCWPLLEESIQLPRDTMFLLISCLETQVCWPCKLLVNLASPVTAIWGQESNHLFFSLLQNGKEKIQISHKTRRVRNSEAGRTSAQKWHEVHPWWWAVTQHIGWIALPMARAWRTAPACPSGAGHRRCFCLLIRSERPSRWLSRVRHLPPSLMTWAQSLGLIVERENTTHNTPWCVFLWVCEHTHKG